MRTIVLGLALFVLLFSCTDAVSSKKGDDQVRNARYQQGQTEKLKDTTLVSQFNLVDVQTLNQAIFVELKYATPDNFMGIILYKRLKKAYLQKDVAERLSKVQDYLSKLNPGFHLLIYDALRPVSVQQKMWDALDSLPPIERGKFVSNPKNRSMHNMGAAVDLTIIDQNGKPLDMGATYDDIRQIAYPSMEKQFVAEGKLTEIQIENRDLLRKVMKSQGFRQLQTEWWHFNACSRAEGLLKYKVLMEEP
jgi:D-alanyl-D-alanine dipeptidase